MGKITKTMQAKHKETLSPWLKGFVESATTIPLPLLPHCLSGYPSRWPFGRGDLYHWIPLLNRFDSILENFSTIYDLNKGPQLRDFGCHMILRLSEHPGPEGRKDTPEDFEIPADGDAKLVEAVLKFTRMLLEHCGNRSIYASSGHLNDLLNSTDWSILIATLEVGSELAQRYQASVRRIGNASRQISSALLANHYNIDLDRVQQLALPFVKTPIVALGDVVPSVTPSSVSKGKEKAHPSGTKITTSAHANDLGAVACSDDATRWIGWGDVKVTYYPQEPVSDPSARVDATRSSLPSTPTPLRRSSTIGAHHQSTPRARNISGDDSSPLAPRTPGFIDETVSSGQKSFELPQSLVTSASMHDLLTRIPEDMPSSTKYEVFHRLRVAKSLTGTREARQQLLAGRLLAIINLAYIHSEPTFVEKVLRQDSDESRRFQLAYQLAELIHPSTDGNTEVPTWLQTIALALLEAMSTFHARCQDVLSALNANVNHGILLYVIRKAVAGMKVNDGTERSGTATESDHWRDNLFSLTLHLAMHTRVGPEMVSAGLMEVMVEILTIRSEIAHRHHSMVIAFLDGLIWTYQNAFTAFFSANGLDAVAMMVVDTVQLAKGLIAEGRGTSQDHRSSAVDYKIPYYQQQTLRWLLKFIHHILSNSYSYGGNTDRLVRNLADKSDLLQSLRDVMADKSTFGSVDWTNSVTILMDLINNDPTSFAVILESGMIKTFLEAITNSPLSIQASEENRAENADQDDQDDQPASPGLMAALNDDDRPHPPTEEILQGEQRGTLAAGILPSVEAIHVVPQVLNSVSLNNAGMKMVVSSRAFDKFLEIFESPTHVKSMEADTDLASNVGACFDELVRHHPALRSTIARSIVDTVARVRFFGIEKARTAGWGTKLLVKTSDGKVVSVAPDGAFNDAIDLSQPPKASSVSTDADIDMADATPTQDPSLVKPDGNTRDSPDNSFTPYVFALASFLSGCMTTNHIKSPFAEMGGIELLLDICESPSLEATFGDSLASRTLAQVVSQMVEFCPVRALPSVLNRAQAALDVLEPLALKGEPVPPLFAQFLSQEFSVSHTDRETCKFLAKGTPMVKALLNAQTLIKITSECFLASRSNTLGFYPINVYDLFLRLVKTIGPLFPGVLAEEAGQLSSIPQHWSPKPKSSVDGTSHSATVETESDPSSLLILRDGLGRITPSSSPGRPTEQEQSSPQFHNYEVFRNLLHPMIPTTFPLLQSLGKALCPRREVNQGDMYPRPRHIEIARALANAVLDHLRPSVSASNPTSKDFHYWIIMLHTVYEMLIEHSAPRHSDRSTPQVIIPVLLAFKEEGGFSVMNLMLRAFAQCIIEASSSNSDESSKSKSKVAAFGLKKILDLFFVLSNGKIITDSAQLVNLQRQTDRAQTVPNIFLQLLVEIRAAVLPAIAELWNSSIVESVPEATAKRLIEILKLIALAEHEPPTTPEDKLPFLLLKYTDTRYNWRTVRRTVEDVLHEDYDEDLVHEAIFRANGQPNATRDYCRAHRQGLAGSRNPIPLEDADTSAMTGARAPRADRTSSHGTGFSSDADMMSIDNSPSISGDNIGYLVDRSSIVTETEDTQEARNTQNIPEATLGKAAAVEPAHRFVATKQSLDQQRADLRKDLIDRSLDVIRTHPDSTIEVSELIQSTAWVGSENNFEEVCSTITFALSSLAFDEEEKKKNGKCIAAYAHLLALLVRIPQFLEHNVEMLRDKVEEYTVFLRVPSSISAEDLPPWIPFILLIVELLLARDEIPVEAKWKAPKTLDEIVAQPVLDLRLPVLDESQRRVLLDALLDLLPRIGKEGVLAIAVLRVLVILTRKRTIAKLVGEKKNLQRLFLMAKQLAGSGSERLKQSKSTAYIMTILRHVIEDEEVTKQIMRAEIKDHFLTLANRGQRTISDITYYLRTFAAAALRAPDLFVEVTNEIIEFQKWSPVSNETSRPAILCLKDESKTNVKDNYSTEIPSDLDVKPSTELADKEMSDVPKSHQDSKRPVVENPDGVIHFLLCELVTYREVDDKDPPTAVSKEAKPESDSTAHSGEDHSAQDVLAIDAKDKKPPKPIFKSEEHPIFVYRCFLLNCLTELLQSYNRTKVEFINFKRSSPPLSTGTPVKPRSSVLNYLIYDLLCQINLSGTNETIASKKKATTSQHTQKLLVALVSKTKERPIDRSLPKLAYDDDPDLQFVRKFVLDTILKAYERAPTSDDPLETRYSRMQCLAELMNSMAGERDKEHGNAARFDQTMNRSQAQIRRLMYEKGYLEKLTSSIAEVNLHYPGVKRAIKYILRVLRVLTDTAKELSHSNLLPSNSATDSVDDDDIVSTSSLSDLEDAREETPDLYRNSSLGMLEPGGDDESEDDDEDVEDMYGDEYDDEMEYDEDDMSDDDHQDNISEDSEMGEIEGLSGDPEVVEVIMDEDDDDDEDDSDEDESDEMDSDDIEDAESRVEIVDEDGHPMEDDGESDWESDNDMEDEELEGEDYDYEAQAQDVDEVRLPGFANEMMDEMARRIMMEGDDYDPDLIDPHYPDDDDDQDDDDEEEGEEEIEDEEYIYDDDYPLDDQPPPITGNGWVEGLEEEVDRHRLIVLDNAGHRSRRLLTRMDDRGSFPPGPPGAIFMNPRNPAGSMAAFRSYFTQGRAAGHQPNSDDGMNPLLRRQDQRHDNHSGPGQPGVRVRLPEGFMGLGRHGMDAGLLGDLMDILPAMGRNGGHALHFHITGGPHEANEMIPPRAIRHDQRRETAAQEPHQAVSFGVQTTISRYEEEARMLFGNPSSISLRAAALCDIIYANLAPAAIEAEKKRVAEEAERKKAAEEERIKKEEEERRIREAKEAEEQAAREQKEAEEREAAERAASEAAANAPQGDPHAVDSCAMEGVEITEQGDPAQQDAPINTAAGADQPRVMAMLGNQEIDVTDLGIDPDYLAALPEEFREEVIAQTVSARRSEARAEAPAGETAAFQEFLDALPPQLRREIEQQEAQEQRRRDHGTSRPTASSARDVIVGDMDPASILLTFPPELREQVLLEQGEELMDQLPPDMAEQARRLQRSTAVPRPVAGNRPSTAGVVRVPPTAAVPNESKTQRRTVVQMLDKHGVATLLRLMFIAQQGSIRNYLFSVFADVCENRQTRLEVISTILQILQEGSIDMGAVDRSFGHLSLKAKKHKEKEKGSNDADQKISQSIKRPLSTTNTAITTQPNSETSPLLIVQQCLDLLVDLSTRNPHIPWLFLTEHETVGSTLKRTLSRKGKLKDTKSHKYAINSLLTLLDRDLVMESSVVMTHLADLLNRVTLPLQALERRRKDAEEGKAPESKSGESPAEQQNPAGEGNSAQSVGATAGPALLPEQTTLAGGENSKEYEPDATQKKTRQIQPPLIPPQNLTLVIRVFVARECSSKTFQNTISTIKNLSTVPGAKTIFGQELVHQARLLSENIVSDLDDLLPHIEKATSGTEIQGVALSKFSPGASEQNKLLRVLTALDHLFDGKKKSNGGSDTEKYDLVTSLYHNSTFSAMWEKLSACLAAIHERENMLNVATILLPLIESLMVVCKNTTVQDDPSQSLTDKDLVLSSPPPESRTANLFFSFTEDHRRILNELVRHNPKLMSGTFALLVKNPKVLEFDNKRNYFSRSVHSRSGQAHHARTTYPALNLSVRRDQVFHDSFKSLYFKTGDEMKFGKLNIRFHGEEGVDAGGVTREWFQVLARQMFDANYALYIPVSSDRTTFHPNKSSGVNEEHLLFFKFIGRIISKALYEGRVLDCYFSRAVYKRILGKSVSVKDMESFDPDYYKSLCWMLENDITDIITETFSVEDEEFGVTNVVDLIPNGRDVAVTEENKKEYVRLVVEHKLLSSVKEQMERFLEGFHDIIPAELISIFNEQELELLISGLPEIEVDDWKSNTEYQNYTPSSPQIQWFWRAVRSFDKEERAKLLQFVTGTSKVPLNGFKELEGMNGVNRFNIHRAYGDKNRLPTSHTCFNQLDLPEYESYDYLRSQLMKAITAGSQYFGFA